ncbi:23509_t:CDS:1, partial [Racocetra persica]
SDLVINKENYDGELAREHEEWTGEICQLIKNSPGYGEWERR